MTTVALVRMRISQKAVYIPVMVAILLLPALLYNLPIIGQGVEDFNTVLHFDESDGQLYQFHGQYEKGPLYAVPFDNMNVYPKAFYSLAGVVLYPYTAIAGQDVTTVVVTWRVLNMLATMGAVIVLFLLARRVFKSDIVAFVGAFAFAITPEVLIWTAAVRPNPLEYLLTFATLYLCVRLIERFSYRAFLLVALLGGLAFATKYGGWIFVILLPALALYLLRRNESTGSLWSDFVGGQVRLFRAVAPLLVVVVGVLGGGLGWLMFTNSWDPVALVLDVSGRAFPPDKLARAPVYLENWRWLLELVAYGGLALSVIVIGGLLALWRAARPSTFAGTVAPSAGMYALLGVLLTAQVIVIYVVVYLVTGPVYVAQPDYLVSQGGWTVYWTALGGSHGGLGGTAAGVESVGNSFRILVDQLHIGWIGFGGLLLYALYREISQKGRPSVDRNMRTFLWISAGIIVAIVLASRLPQIRHMLPAVGILYLFIADAIVPRLSAISRPENWRVASATALPLVILLVVMVGFHFNGAYEDWDYKRSKPQDTGLEVGSWLKQHYPEDTRIMTDWWTFYVPPIFTNTATVTHVDRAERRTDFKRQAVRDAILDFDPQVIIVARPEGVDELVNVLPLIKEDPVLRSRDYRLVKRYDYEPGERKRYHDNTHLLVFERGQGVVRIVPIVLASLSYRND